MTLDTLTSRRRCRARRLDRARRQGDRPSTEALAVHRHRLRLAVDTAHLLVAVVAEQYQLLRMNENYTDHAFVSNLYQKNIAMLKMALK